jgi:dihydroorotate dehydrogenase
MIYQLVRFFLFKLDPESAHNITLKFLKHFFPTWLNKKLRKKMQLRPTHFCGLTFPNPVGLAAGFDKNAECIDALLGLGFGFIEVGTVTPKAQDGNPKPRLFRIPKAHGLINRMGFNNLGVDQLVEHLKSKKIEGIVGVNIGKNKDTPLEQAVNDYIYCLKKVYLYTDYIVINISSPNTPDLRKLQTETYLDELLNELNIERQKLSLYGQKQKPLFLKISVDLNEQETEYLVRTSLRHQIDGIITSNTTINHSAILNLAHADESGGLSGEPLFKKNLEMIYCIRRLAKNKLPIIAVGGILSANQALQYFKAGASLVQIYTGLVYRGPRLIKKILRTH